MQFKLKKSLPAILTALLLLFSGSVVAASVHGMRFKDWIGRCEQNQGTQVCYLEQTLKQGGQLLMNAVIGYAPGKPQPTVFFELPVGIDIGAGVSLVVDRQKPVWFTGRCDEQMCTAGFMLKPEALSQFIKGSKAYVSYASSDGKQFRLPLSLMGVTAGLSALQ